MIQVQGLSKGYGGQDLFHDINFLIEKGERLGIAGRNGSGKTTLFRLLSGEESPDAGKVSTPSGYRMGMLRQHLVFEKNTVREEALLALPEQEGGWKEEHLADEILGGLGFATQDLQRPPSEFSGGYQVRLHLAQVLLGNPDCLLLDEPTNYLDIVSLRWLERFLKSWKGEVLIITHDRGFMDRVCTHTLAIHRKKILRMRGSTEKLYAQLEENEIIHEKTRVNQEKRLAQTERFISRFRAQANKAKAVQSRVRALAKEDRIKRLENEENLDFRFPDAPFPGKWMLRCENLSFGYDRSAPALFEKLDLSVTPGERIAVIGANGKGKTTLLNMLSGELISWSGEINNSPNLQTGFFGQMNISRLRNDCTVEEEILSALPNPVLGHARSLAGLMLFTGDNALKKVKILSGGERSRVLLAKLLAKPSNLLLLDEPTNHLDQESIESLLQALELYQGTVVMVTHSESILRRLATHLVIFDQGKVEHFEGSYDDFLERRGWSSEKEILQKSSQKPFSTQNRKEDRRKRAEEQDLLNQKLRPLQKEAERLEREIDLAEKRENELQLNLQQASDEGNSKDLWTLSEELDTLNKKRDRLYAGLEKCWDNMEKIKTLE